MHGNFAALSYSTALRAGSVVEMRAGSSGKGEWTYEVEAVERRVERRVEENRSDVEGAVAEARREAGALCENVA